jgi:hypothetical protein
MTEQEKVQVSQADESLRREIIQMVVDALDARNGEPLGFFDRIDVMIARHRHTATAEALELLKRARDREHNPYEPWNQTKLYHDLTAAIARIEGEQP